VADDHPLMRTALRKSLERAGIEVVAEAGDGEEAVRLAVQMRPDIALLDLVMPHIDGLQAARQVAKACPDTRVVMISGFLVAEHIDDAVRAGAAAFIAKAAKHADLVEIVRAVLDGRPYTGTPTAGLTLERGTEDRATSPLTGDLDKLTAREREILRLVVQGHSSGGVASLLGVSTRTVERHRQNIMSKLAIHSVAGLTRYAIERGFA